MLLNWDENSTWNSLGNGVQRDGVEALTFADAVIANPEQTGAKELNMTGALQAWSNGAVNLGWVIVNNSTNDIKFRSSEANDLFIFPSRERPKLSVTYRAATANDIPEPGSVALLLMGVPAIVGLVRRKK